MSNDKQVKLSEVVRCGHCLNSAPMSIVGTHSQCEEEEQIGGWVIEQGEYYELLECPACKEMTLRKSYYHSDAPPDYFSWVNLYPVDTKTLLGLPRDIESNYQAAQRIRSIDANSYGVLIGRLLELVCEDQKAVGKTLHERLTWLAKQGQIPGKLADAANRLKNLRNIGAHASLGELTPAEVPIVDDLSRAILEYIYSLPALVTKADRQIESLKSSAKKKKKKWKAKKAK